jgi:adenosylcobinamide kinase/adenosylcobinamide-phosphate guanylyltransferase
MAETENKNGRLILLLGGARGGKSAHALRLAQNRARTSGESVCFIATAQGLDEDMAQRIVRHQAERPIEWRTIEEPCQIDEALRKTTGAGIVIVDCLTLFVSNWLMRHEDEHKCELVLRNTTREFLELARVQQQIVICISNEVGLGIVPDNRMGRVFRDLLGRVNQDFAAAADEVYLLVAGLPLQLKPAASA